MQARARVAGLRSLAALSRATSVRETRAIGLLQPAGSARGTRTPKGGAQLPQQALTRPRHGGRPQQQTHQAGQTVGQTLGPAEARRTRRGPFFLYRRRPSRTSATCTYKFGEVYRREEDKKSPQRPLCNILSTLPSLRDRGTSGGGPPPGGRGVTKGPGPPFSGFSQCAPPPACAPVRKRPHCVANAWNLRANASREVRKRAGARTPASLDENLVWTGRRVEPRSTLARVRPGTSVQKVALMYVTIFSRESGAKNATARGGSGGNGGRLAGKTLARCGSHKSTQCCA